MKDPGVTAGCIYRTVRDLIIQNTVMPDCYRYIVQHALPGNGLLSPASSGKIASSLSPSVHDRPEIRDTTSAPGAERSSGRQLGIPWLPAVDQLRFKKDRPTPHYASRPFQPGYDEKFLSYFPEKTASEFQVFARGYGGGRTTFF
jgi:hypothetical protein